MFEKLVFTDENGDETEFFVLEQTRVNGINYLLVSDTEDDEEEAEALIIKDMSRDTDTEAVYEIVDDDDELEVLTKIFNELLDDIDVE